MSLRDELLFLRNAARLMGDFPEREKCFRLLRQGAPYDELFFGELSDPRWLPILTERGFFRCLPLPINSDDGNMLRNPWHLPLQCLPRLAAQVPKEVARLLQSMHIPANPTVHDQTMRVIAAIKDPSCIGDVLPVLQQILRSLSTSNWLWLSDIFGNWIREGAVDTCYSAIATFLREALAVHEEGKPPGDRWRLSELDNQVIVPLAATEPMRVAVLLHEMLIIWAESERARTFAAKKAGEEPFDPERDPDHDFPPTYWLQDFKAGSYLDGNIEGMLAHRLYFVGETMFKVGRAVEISAFDDLLRRDRWHLFSRLRWQLYADFPEQTLEWARKDVLARIPRLGDSDAVHEHEMAAMLLAQTETHGSNFLEAQEANRFVSAVLAGPTNASGEEPYRRYFQRRQLFPIRRLLDRESLDKYRQLSVGETDPSLESYRPFHLSSQSGTVEQRSPIAADEMAEMSDSDLWRLLNEWTPAPRSQGASFWIEETLGALGKEFAIFAQAHTERFPAAAKWWMEIRRPAILGAPLELATNRLKEKTEGENQGHEQPSADEWSGWLGLVARLAAPIQNVEPEVGQTDDDDDPDAQWHWPRILAVRFLTTTCQIANGQQNLPLDWLEQARDLLGKLVKAPDPRLDERPTPALSGWLSTAINSVRGTALEGLLQLALSGEKNNADASFRTAIFLAVAQQLELPDASPAVFAVIGANLRLAVHLFPQEITAAPQRMLRPGANEQKVALLTSHFAYDRPMVEILAVLPDLPSEALKLLQQFNMGGLAEREGAKDFGGRLGTHLGFYCWNRAFPNDSAAWASIDEFFDLAAPRDRAAMIADIGRIFSGVTASEQNQALCQRVMELWDRRFLQIESTLVLDVGSVGLLREEMGEFFDWFECECFPFEWRATRTIKAIKCMDQAPRAFSLLDTLKDFSSRADRLDHVIEIFHDLVSKPSNDLRWSYQVAVLKSLLERGLSSGNPTTRRLALGAQERLLSQGLFDYLDIAAAGVRAASR